MPDARKTFSTMLRSPRQEEISNEWFKAMAAFRRIAKQVQGMENPPAELQAEMQAAMEKVMEIQRLEDAEQERLHGLLKSRQSRQK